MSDLVRLDTYTGQLRTIRLHGVLGRRFGKVHRMAVSSAAEAVRALGSQLRGFDAFLTQSKDKGLAYAVFYGRKNLGEEELRNPVGADDIRFVPIVIGSKNGGWLQIILGVVLILVGTFATMFTGPVGAAMVSMGWAMVIGGIVQLLTPTPKGRSAKDRPENEPSYAFNGPINTQAQGHPVQVLYGELIVGSAVLSAGIEAKDSVYIPTTDASGGGGTGSGGGGGGGSPPWHNLIGVD
jgi:predicted phage tail protein